jgi:hypothetical protein
MAWSMKGFVGPSLSIIHSFCKQKTLMVLQKVHVAIVLCHKIMAIGKASSRLGVFPNFLPISLHDLLHATSDEFKSKVSCFLF